MREYVTDAIILDREPVGEYDSRVHCFTERFGRVSGRATSARKITSKLSAHIAPGARTRIRFAEKRGVQVTDALMSGRVAMPAPELARLMKLLPDHAPDPELWALLCEESFSWSRILAVLGWDPQGSACGVCGGRPDYFYIAHHEFLCELCASGTASAAVIALPGNL